jgi:hypothetical protein
MQLEAGSCIHFLETLALAGNKSVFNSKKKNTHQANVAVELPNLHTGKAIALLGGQPPHIRFCPTHGICVRIQIEGLNP